METFVKSTMPYRLDKLNTERASSSPSSIIGEGEEVECESVWSGAGSSAHDLHYVYMHRCTYHAAHVEAWEQAPLPIEPSLSAPLDLLRLPKLEFSSPMCSSPLCPLLHLSLSESPLPPALLTETSAYSLPFSKGTVIAQKWYLPFQPTPSYSFCFHKAHYSTLPFLS